MGYKPVKKRYNIAFVQYEGLEMVCKGTTMGKLIDIAQQSPRLEEPDENKRMELFSFFTSRIISWNLVHPAPDDDSDVCACGLAEDDELPVTVEGMRCLEFDFLMQLFYGYVTAISTVSPEKKTSLNAGERIQTDLTTRLASLQSPLPSPTLS